MWVPHGWGGGSELCMALDGAHLRLWTIRLDQKAHLVIFRHTGKRECG